jgi:hypothetical protein
MHLVPSRRIIYIYTNYLTCFILSWPSSDVSSELDLNTVYIRNILLYKDLIISSIYFRHNAKQDGYSHFNHYSHVSAVYGHHHAYVEQSME